MSVHHLSSTRRQKQPKMFMFQIMVIIAVLKIIMLQLSWSSFLLLLRVRGLVPVVYKGLPIIQDNHIPYQGDYLVQYLGAQNLYALNHLGHHVAPPSRPGPSCVQRIAIREQDQSYMLICSKSCSSYCSKSR